MNEEDDGNMLDPSPLGTKEHWDDVYQSELNNFDNCGDEGEVWFGKATGVRMINYLSTASILQNEPIVDVGCGNGMLLWEAWKAGFRSLLGVDYSANAIKLASSIAKLKECPMKFEVQDITNWTGPRDYFKVALDKGTYDAISLNPDNALSAREAYLNTIWSILSSGSFLIITTCNWTEAEIISQFSSKLDHVATLPSPQFSFGGKSGSRTTIAVFRKPS